MPAVKYHLGKFPPDNINWEKLVPLIGPANAAVARYAGLLQGIPNVQILLSPLLAQEAVLSSKIEGTQATLGEVLEFEAGKKDFSEVKRDDIEEVLNYRQALRFAMGAMKELPLSQRLLRDTHQKLLNGVRGAKKMPGQYRRVQNFIGTLGCTEDTARYVPPGPEKVADLMTNWEKYLHNKPMDKLVQLAILHAEFESIHPFLDGNGRTGRLLVPLFMVDQGILDSPDFYISAYLESRREEYYERLLAVSRDGDWTGWCTFFLTAIIEQAKNNEDRATAILDLYQQLKEWIVVETNSSNAVRALDWFFERPIFKMPDFWKTSGIPKPTAGRIVRIVRDKGLLRVLDQGGGRRPMTLCFPELLNIGEGSDVF